MSKIRTSSATAPAANASATNGTQRARAAVVGALFITSTITFAIGSAQINAYFKDPSKSRRALAVGVLLEAYTAIAVVGIALAVLPLLRESKQMARGYVALRALECTTILGAGAVMLAADKQLRYENLLYVFTGAGGILLALLLLRSGLTRRWISILGLVGYPVLLLGVLADMLGVVDLGSNAGAVFFVPGGLFEIVLPLQLFAFGFHRTPGTRHRRSARVSRKSVSRQSSHRHAHTSVYRSWRALFRWTRESHRSNQHRSVKHTKDHDEEVRFPCSCL
jgi:hypothetical protein